MTRGLRTFPPQNTGCSCGLRFARLHSSQTLSSTHSRQSATVAHEGCVSAYAQPSQCVYNTGGCAPRPERYPFRIGLGGEATPWSAPVAHGHPCRLVGEGRIQFPVHLTADQVLSGRRLKPFLLDLLNAARRDTAEEWAGILKFKAGMPRAEAERQAGLSPPWRAFQPPETP